jgi:5-methyltetrahydrofolate--homocysteine methyltransferase
VLLTTCYNSVTNTVVALRDAGRRDGLSVMVGGAAASQLLSDKAGCDFYGRTAVDGLNHAKAVVGAG